VTSAVSSDHAGGFRRAWEPIGQVSACWHRPPGRSRSVSLPSHRLYAFRRCRFQSRRPNRREG